MANKEHLEILKRGPQAWNQWREQHPEIKPDLSGADLRSVKFTLSREEWVKHHTADPRMASYVPKPVCLDGTDLTGADLRRVDFERVSLKGANLSDVDMFAANLSGADLSDANLAEAWLMNVKFSNTKLNNTNFENAEMAGTIFSDVDLSTVKGLDATDHFKPSTVGIDTLYKSGGQIPPAFLRGCGVPDELIDFLPSLMGAGKAIQFYSCFISYSNRDEEFARRLYSRMRDEHLRVWFAPEDIKGGEKLKDQIDRAIQIHDRLLIILSENSMRSDWVTTEIRRARRVEAEEGRRKLFPIRLTSYETLQGWECFDADTGRDLAREVREYFIPDFSNWKDHDSFEAGFAKLLRDLRAAEAG